MQGHGSAGTSMVIKGDLSAQEDVAIGGRFEGTIDVSGYRITIAAGTEVVADIAAAEIIVGGQVMGTAVATRRIELTATAEMEGELRAPAIALADGAVFQGRAETQPPRTSNLQLAS